ncbi:unnamed protein product [Musa acuminata subsp. burmannicoides]
MLSFGATEPLAGLRYRSVIVVERANLGFDIGVSVCDKLSPRTRRHRLLNRCLLGLARLRALVSSTQAVATGWRFFFQCNILNPVAASNLTEMISSHLCLLSAYQFPEI